MRTVSPPPRLLDPLDHVHHVEGDALHESAGQAAAVMGKGEAGEHAPGIRIVTRGGGAREIGKEDEALGPAGTDAASSLMRSKGSFPVLVA